MGKEKLEIHYLKLQQALASHRLKSWPYDGPIGIRESDSLSAKTAVHVFQNWCHIGTVDEESEFHELMNSKSVQTFDLDTYKLLTKELRKKNTHIINFGTSIRLNADTE